MHHSHQEMIQKRTNYLHLGPKIFGLFTFVKGFKAIVSITLQRLQDPKPVHQGFPQTSLQIKTPGLFTNSYFKDSAQLHALSEC